MKGLVNSTLREGEQTPGIFFSSADKIGIASLLIQVGMEEIELGVASSRDQELFQLMEEVRVIQKKSGSRCREEDISLAAEPPFLEKVVRAAEEAGAQRIRFADTVGLLTPVEIGSRITHLKTITSMEIGVHCHNDFGGEMAARLTGKIREMAGEKKILTCLSLFRPEGLLPTLPGNAPASAPEDAKNNKAFLCALCALASVYI